MKKFTQQQAKDIKFSLQIFEEDMSGGVDLDFEDWYYDYYIELQKGEKLEDEQRDYLKDYYF